MAKYANQDSAVTTRDFAKGQQYIRLSMEHFSAASKVLTGNGLRLFIYFCSWDGGVEFDISPAAIYNRVGLKPGSYYAARDELIAKGFLEKNKQYSFTEIPTLRN